MVFVGLLRSAYAGLLNYVWTTLSQRLTLRGVPGVDDVGGDATGLTVIITGPTSGIGKATAGVLARRGAHVVLACRSQSKGDALVKELQQKAKDNGQKAPSLEVAILDVSDFESVRRFAANWERSGRPVHVLINNAGLYNLGVGRTETKTGLEVHLATNHLGPFLLTLLMLPALKRGAAAPPQRPRGSKAFKGARIVSVVSEMMYYGYAFGPADPQCRKWPYSAGHAYGNSKLAQVLFISELRRRLPQDSGITAIAVHPGNVLTGVVRSLPKVIQKLYGVLMKSLLLTPEEGARPSIYAATNPDAPAATAATNGFMGPSCKPELPSKRAQDELLAAWLWRYSADLVQLPPEADLQ